MTDGCTSLKVELYLSDLQVRGVDIEDVMAEARSLWLDAAAQCDFSKATLNSFGTMFVSQRLYK